MPDALPGQSLDSLWGEVQHRLRSAVPESTFKIWLEPLRAVGAQGATLYLSAPDGIRTWVERRYVTLLREALTEVAPALSEVAFAGGEPSAGGARASTQQSSSTPITHLSAS